MAEKIKEITASDYQKEVLDKDVAVVDFYSTECPPCEALAPKFEGLSELYGDDVPFVKVFRQGNRGLAESLDVTGSPTVLFYHKGTLVGDRLTGGIRRADLMKNLAMLIPEERAAKIQASVKPVVTETDVVILGGGPAGLTAGIYLAQAHIDVVLVDTALPGGYVSTTHLVSNYPGFIEPQNGYLLSHMISEQAKVNGVRFRPAVDVESIDLQNKTVIVDGHETIKAKKIIIATGSRPRPLGIPGEKEHRGSGISYCATCDAKYYQDKDVVVIGGGNSAVEESLFISRFARRITVVHQFDKLQANRQAQETAFANDAIDFLFEHEPRQFTKYGTMDMGVEVEDLTTGKRHELRANGVFVFVGFVPNLDDFAASLERDQWGYLKTDEEMRTSVEGVYAIGDVRTKSYRQITTAVSDGTIAAIAISREL